jgi:hypothetical protein
MVVLSLLLPEQWLVLHLEIWLRLQAADSSTSLWDEEWDSHNRAKQQDA